MAGGLNLDVFAAQRIRFHQGETTAHVKGALHGHKDEVCYVLHARAGQHLKITINADGATRGEVISPSGERNGQPGDAFFDDALGETGDYRLCVNESAMGDSWSGRFMLTIILR